MTLSAAWAIAKLEIPINYVFVTPLTENMPSGRATKPGDIVVAANGVTIEVDNTGKSLGLGEDPYTVADSTLSFCASHAFHASLSLSFPFPFLLLLSSSTRLTLGPVVQTPRVALSSPTPCTTLHLPTTLPPSSMQPHSPALSW